MKKLGFVSAFLALFGFAFSVLAAADVKTTVTDTRASYSFDIHDDVEWSFDTEIDQGNTVTCASTVESVEPLTTICVTTKIAANDLAVSMPSLGVAQQKMFIKGACKSYQCRDETGVIKSEELNEKKFGEITGFEFASELKHAAYLDSGLSDSIFFITMTPTGQLQLFTLHTDIGNAASYRDVFESAIASVRYNS